MPETKKRSVGTVTVLFTDVVGSTELMDRWGDDFADRVRRKHFKRLRQLIRAFGGTEVKSLGDGLMVVFSSASDAAGCAVCIQQAAATDPDALPVRVGLHTGEAVREENDLYGGAVVVARRLCDRAEGGQILASDLVRGLIGRRGNFQFNDLGFLDLKGFQTPVPAAEVLWREHPAELLEPEPAEPVAPDRSKLPAFAAAVLFVVALAAAMLVLTDRNESPESTTPSTVTDPRLGAISVEWAIDDIDVETGGLGEQIMLDLTIHKGHLLAPGRDAVGDDLQATMWIGDRAGQWSKVHLDGTEPRTGENMVFGVVGRGRTLVAVGSDGAPLARDAATWISTDLGRHWTRTDEGLSVSGNEAMFAVADNGRRFVAVGYASSGAGQGSAAIWHSRNGRSWTRIPNEAIFGGGPTWGEARDVIARSGGFVVVGGTGVPDLEDEGDAAVWLSPTGLEWERVDSPDFVRPQGQRMMSVVRTPPGFLAAGFDSAAGNQDAALWRSPDARDWRRIPHDEAHLGGVSDQVITALAKGPGFFAALGWDGTEENKDAALWLSLNGLDWRRMPHDENVLGGDGAQEFRGVVIDGMEIMGAGASGENGDPDGTLWRAKVEGL
jgi:class 3 adenylate cyclase